jgi:hypothetical protein
LATAAAGQLVVVLCDKFLEWVERHRAAGTYQWYWWRLHSFAGRYPDLTVEDLKAFLADHEGKPTSICRHPHDGPDHPSVSARGRTVASIIAEPGEGRMHVARGNPCQTPYATYRLT